jgi:hypothetical protein
VSRDPDIAAAIPDLVGRGLLSPAAAAVAARPVRGDLLSVRAELRGVLYLGVLALVAGVSLLVRENLAWIGPAGVAFLIGLAALVALWWVQRRAPAFHWGKVPAPHLAFEYVLLLGMLLLGADLAYIEARFAPLGPAWTWHLLLVAVLYASAAVRFDSRPLFALALSTFSAWRGVAVSFGAAATILEDAASALRWNAIGCAVLFVVLAQGLRRFQRKAHFAPVAEWLGWILGLLALLGGSLEGESIRELVWALALLLAGCGLAAGAFLVRRFGLFALGVLAAYAALTRLLVVVVDEPLLGCFWLMGSSLALLAGLVFAQRRMRERA